MCHELDTWCMSVISKISILCALHNILFTYYDHFKYSKLWICLCKITNLDSSLNIYIGRRFNFKLMLTYGFSTISSQLLYYDYYYFRNRISLCLKCYIIRVLVSFACLVHSTYWHLLFLRCIFLWYIYIYSVRFQIRS